MAESGHHLRISGDKNPYVGLNFPQRGGERRAYVTKPARLVEWVYFRRNKKNWENAII
jgi:hypothetical protein